METAGVRPGDPFRSVLAVEQPFRITPDKKYHTVASVRGSDSWVDCADVQVSVPTAWGANVSWRLLIRNGSIISPLAFGHFDTFLYPGFVSGIYTSGTIHRVRGVQFDEIILEVFAGTAQAGKATARLSAWARSTYPLGELIEDGAIKVQIEDAFVNAVDLPGGPLLSRAVNNGGVASLVVGVSQEILNQSATDLWLLMWKSLVAKAAGSHSDFVPIRIPAGGRASRDLGECYCWPGLWWAASTVADPYTVPADGLWVDTVWRVSP